MYIYTEMGLTKCMLLLFQSNKKSALPSQEERPWQGQKNV